MRNLWTAVAVSCTIASLSAAPARAQTFTGVIADSAGRVIPGAEARLASMDTRAVVTVVAGADGAFSVTAPRTNGKRRRYYAELCAAGFAPQVEIVPLAPGDTLVVRGELAGATNRAVPVGTGACAWQSGPASMTIIGGRGFGVTAVRAALLVDSIQDSYPRNSSARMVAMHADERAWRHRMNAAQNAAARERAAWIVLQLARLEDTPDQALLAAVRHALPPTSRWWQAGSSIIPVEEVETLFGVELRDTSAHTLAARRAARNYIARISAARFDPDVDAQVQHELARYDLALRDTAAVTRRARALLTAHPGYTGAKLSMFRFRWITPLRDNAPVPQFDFATLPGAARPRLTNRDLTAPYTLLVFWGTWCTHCIEELPTLDSLHTEYHGRGLDIVSIAADDSPEATDAFVRTHDMPWRHAYAGTTEDPFLQQIGVVSYPTTVLVDSTGTILASNATSAGPRAMVEKFLKK